MLQKILSKFLYFLTGRVWGEIPKTPVGQKKCLQKNLHCFERPFIWCNYSQKMFNACFTKNLENKKLYISAF